MAMLDYQWLCFLGEPISDFPHEFEFNQKLWDFSYGQWKKTLKPLKSHFSYGKSPSFFG